MKNIIKQKNEIFVFRQTTTSYPDFPYNNNPNNELQSSFSRLLFDLGLDKLNYNTEKWNPFGKFIKAGQTAVIKPNWVMHFNPLGYSTDSLVTHTSIIRYVIDYLLIAMKGSGTIIITDAPLQGCNWNALLEQTKILKLVESEYKNKYPKITFNIIDLRKTLLNAKSKLGVSYTQTNSAGDPQGYSLIDLADESLLTDLKNKADCFRVTMYDYKKMLKHHSEGKHEYLISNTILKADFLINLPKIKTHLKAGLTGALKNLVGINGHKEYLPHHIQGCPTDGGDQYINPSTIKNIFNKVYDYYWSNLENFSQFNKFIVGITTRALLFLSLHLAKDDLVDGGWPGNQTIPRTTLDLNKILILHGPKHILHIADGIIAGQGNGPLKPAPVKMGIIAASTNPLLMDIFLARMMGYNYQSIPTLNLGYKHPNSPFIHFILPSTKLPLFKFIKPKHWEKCND